MFKNNGGPFYHFKLPLSLALVSRSGHYMHGPSPGGTWAWPWTSEGPSYLGAAGIWAALGKSSWRSLASTRTVTSMPFAKTTRQLSLRTKSAIVRATPAPLSLSLCFCLCLSLWICLCIPVSVCLSICPSISVCLSVWKRWCADF